MTFEELKAKQHKEWKDFIESYKKSLDAINDEKLELKRVYGFSPDNMPENIQKLLEQRHEQWQKEWGIDGWRNKQLKEKQEKETKQFFNREDIVNSILNGRRRDRNKANER